MAKERIVKVSGFVVFKESDPGYHWSLTELSRSLSGIEDLSLTELPDARRTKKGIRMDGKK